MKHILYTHKKAQKWLKLPENGQKRSIFKNWTG